MTRKAVTAPPREVIDEFTLYGRRVEVRNADLDLDLVKLDPKNPRITNTFAGVLAEKGELSLSDKEGKLQKQLGDLLWDYDSVRELYQQILMNKGLIERIIVKEDGTVIEGNCRTVAYRKLRENYPRETTWHSIPARILPRTIDEKDVAILLGGLHVAHKITWSSFEKAGHVYSLHHEFALTQDEIAKLLRMSKSKVNQLIHAFDTLKNKFMVRYPGPSNVRKFSYFEEFFKNPLLREWANDNDDAIDLFVDLVGKNRISQGVQVRQLPQFLDNPEALRTLTKNGYEAAKGVLEEDNPGLSSQLFQTMESMASALEEAKLDDIQKVRKAKGPAARRLVLRLQQALEHFMELAGLK